MSRTQSVLILLVMWVGGFGLATSSHAEWIIDLYGGGGLVKNGDVSITRSTPSAGISTPQIEATLSDVDVDDMFTGGLRVGYWFKTAPRLLGIDFGLGLDLFYFPLDVPAQTARAQSNVDIEISIGGERIVVEAGVDQPLTIPDIDVQNSAVIAPEFMIRRAFLPSAAFPNGRLQPYLTLSPALLGTGDGPNFSVGFKASGGLAWSLTKHIAVLAEYRFTYFEFDTDDATLLVEGVVITRPEIKTDLTTHFVVAGLSFRF